MVFDVSRAIAELAVIGITGINNIKIAGDLYIPNGNVGIGTASPKHQFESTGAVNTFPIVASAPLGTNDEVSIGLAGFPQGTSPVKAAISLTRKGSYGIGNMIFSVDPNADSSDLNVISDAVMTLQGSNGYVGIGTTSPDAELEVVGDIQYSGDVVHATTGDQLETFRSDAITINHDDAGTNALLTVADGYIITDVYAEITEVWDGNGTVNIGDGDDADGFLTDANLDKENTGYKGLQIAIGDAGFRGAYLGGYDGGTTDSWTIRHAYTGADTIDAVVVAGTSTQGSMTIWIIYQKLK